MSVSDELRDPWGLLVAAGSGGMAAVLTQDNLVVGVAVAGAVLAIKVVTGVLVRGGAKKRNDDELPVQQDSPEDAWLRRTQRAARSLRELAESAEAGPVAERLQSVVAEAGTTMADMRRLAGQTSAVTAAMHRIDLPTLQRERTQLQRMHSSADTAARADADRSMAAVQSQLDVHQRLYDTASAMLGRMQAGALGMESLVAQIAELVALSEGSPGGLDNLQQLDMLAGDLEGLRIGLAETEEMSRKALGAYGGTAAPVFRKDDKKARDPGRAGPLEGGN